MVLAISVSLAAASPDKQRIRNTPTNDLAEGVLHGLIATPLGGTLPPLRWELFLIDDYRISASSDGQGKVFVTTGMARFLGTVRGAWAAVLGHEIGHALILHPGSWPGFEAELRNATRHAPRNCGSIPSATAESRDSLPEIFVRLDHAAEREYAADQVGLLLMAEAGYHPEFAVTLDRWMRYSLGDSPRLTTFLESHPRWQSRQERVGRDSAFALVLFQARWPDAAASPGGLPPPIGTLGPVAIDRSSGSGGLALRVPVSVEKADGFQIRVSVIFLDGRWPVRSTLSEYRAGDGSLELNASFPGSVSDSRVLLLHVPLDAFPNHAAKLRAQTFLMAGDIVLAVAFRPVELGSTHQP